VGAIADDLENWAGLLRVSTRLANQADLVNDSHDHDELHAASIVVLNDLLRDDHYVKRWLQGLMDLYSIGHIEGVI